MPRTIENTRATKSRKRIVGRPPAKKAPSTTARVKQAAMQVLAGAAAGAAVGAVRAIMPALEG